MKDLIAHLRKILNEGPEGLDSFNTMLGLVDEYLMRDTVDMEQSIALTPLSDCILKMRNSVSGGGKTHWDEIKSLLNELDTSGKIPSCEKMIQEIEDMDMLASFIQEAQEHLESVDHLLLKLEKEKDIEHLNAVFRALHTIKGVAGFLHLGTIQTLSHGLENLLDSYRKTRTCPTAACIDILLEGRDLLAVLIGNLEEAADKSGATQGVARLELPNMAIEPYLLKVSQWETSLDPGKNHSIKLSATPSKQTEPDSFLTPELIAKFKDEVTESLENLERNILELEKSGDRKEMVHDLFRLVHTVKGNAGFFGSGNLEKTAMEMEQYLELMRSAQIPITGEEPVSRLLEHLDKLRQAVGISIDATDEKPREDILHPELLSERLEEKTTAPAAHLHKKEVRVDTDKLDRLFDLIGELITAEAMVLDHPQIKMLQLEEFQKSAEYMSKITRELQTVSMNLRMIPLDGLFGRIQRLVRDLAKKFNKPVQLNISGQETEMDRNIIEEISDPLVHIIRNALDHGIESQVERAEKGKASEGKIGLGARYEGNEIWIIVEDDGAGLNREKILEKAKKRELLKTEPGTMTDEQVWALIFEPGFSTAEKVTEVSGRGVGMDVVKKNIEKLRGQVVITSVEGEGSTFILRIPLTLAIMDGITIKAGDGIFSLPVSDVSEFQNHTPELLHRMGNGEEVLNLRGETMPFIRLQEFYHHVKQQEVERPVVLVLHHREKKLALLVDAVIGYKQIVLKSLPDGMQDIRAVSGCTILGNGDVSLIIDTQEFIREVVR